MQFRAVFIAAALACGAAACSSDSAGTTAGSSTGATSTAVAAADTAASDTTAANSVGTGASDTTVFEDGSSCPEADGTSKKIVHFAVAPPTCIDTTQHYTATIVTNLGIILIDLDPTIAPLAVNSFAFLSGYHYFDDTICHRVINAFIIQCGDPTGTGTGDPGYEFKDELPPAGAYKIGSVAMANAGPNTNGSQFFIVTGPRGVELPPNYTLFGEVSGGMDVVQAIDALGSDIDGAPSSTVRISTITVNES